MEKKELKKLSKIIIENKIFCITDEIYSELNYENEHVSIGSFPGMRDYTLYINGFSKSFAMTGWRIGYLAAPEELTQEIVKIHQYSILCAPTMCQYGALEALNNASEDIVRMKSSFDMRRRLLYRGLVDMGMEVEYPKGALYIFPSLKKFGILGKDFAIKLLNEEGVAVIPGEVFGDSFKYYIRCCYAANIDDIKKAVVRMKRTLEKMIKEKNK